MLFRNPAAIFIQLPFGVPGSVGGGVSGNGAPYSARAIAIDDAGRLVVETGGRQFALAQGEVSVKPASL